jgi:uncharacterized protein YjbI with pentapeptide repeats
MGLLRRVSSWIWSLPGNVHFWWTVGIPAVATVLAGTAAYLREASLLVLVLLVICTYLLCFVPTALLLPRRAGRRRTAHQQPTSPEEIQAQDRWREYDALERYFAQMRRWLDDSDAPLQQLPPEHPHHKSAQEDTMRILSRLSPGGKREVVSFLHRRDLIKVGNPIISLVGADLSSANLSGLGLREAEMSHANLRGADLSDAGLCDYQAIGVDLQRMAERDVPQRNFSQPINVSHLIWSDLSGTVLRQARLGGCKLRSADFAGADLDEAELQAADLRRARNLTQEQIEKAYGSKGQEDVEDTLLPGDLKAPKSWEWPLSQQQAMRQSKS